MCQAQYLNNSMNSQLLPNDFIITFHGNNQTMPIIGNILIPANCIIIHHVNTFTHYQDER